MLERFNVAGFIFERVPSESPRTRYDHLLTNGDRLIVINGQSLIWNPAERSRWAAYRIRSGAKYWQPLISAKGRKRFFHTPDTAAGQALAAWAPRVETVMSNGKVRSKVTNVADLPPGEYQAVHIVTSDT